MRKFILLMVVLLPTAVMAQDLIPYKGINSESKNEDKVQKSESHAVEFSSRLGSLITSKIYDMGTIKKIEFEVLEMKDEIKRDKTACMRIRTYSDESRDTYTGVLDSDEIDACIKSLYFMRDSLFKTHPSVYTQSSFKTRDGVSFAAYFPDLHNEWSVYIKTDEFSSYSRDFLDKSDIDLLIIKLQECNEKIKTILGIKK